MKQRIRICCQTCLHNHVPTKEEPCYTCLTNARAYDSWEPKPEKEKHNGKQAHLRQEQDSNS